MVFKLLISLLIGSLCWMNTTLWGSSFEIRPLKVYADPGEQVLVPIVLTSSDSVGVWEILMSFDLTGGIVTGVQIIDSIRASDPEGDTLKWFFAPWAGHSEQRPEYISFLDTVHGYPNQISVMGMMNMPSPPVVPPILPGENLLLFCFVFNVNSSWDGEDLLFSFKTYDCGDNTLTDPGGYDVWGPDTVSANPSTCPQRPDSLRVIRLTPGVGVGKITGIEETKNDERQLKILFEPSFPNPFGYETTIYYWLPKNTWVRLAVWDVRGAQKRMLVDEFQLEGRKSAQWDGRDENGNLLPNGIYFFRIEVPGFYQSRKVILLR